MHSLKFPVLLVGLLLALSGGAWAAAPDFELKDLDGNKVSLEDLLDDNKVLLIDFWQVGCKPCNELLPHLQEYYDDLKDKGAEFIIISRDTSLTMAQVEPFFKSHDYSFTVLLDSDQEVSRDYGVKACPVTVIIDKSGDVIFWHFGYKPGQEEEFLEIVQKALAGEELEAVDIET